MKEKAKNYENKACKNEECELKFRKRFQSKFEQMGKLPQTGLAVVWGYWKKS